MPASSTLNTKLAVPPFGVRVVKTAGSLNFFPLIVTSKAETALPGTLGNAKWIVSPTLALLGNMIRKDIGVPSTRGDLPQGWCFYVKWPVLILRPGLWTRSGPVHRTIY